MRQVRSRRAKARATACSATPAEAAGRRAPRDAAAADAEALRPAVTAVAQTAVAAAAERAEANARRADPERPSSAVSNWDSAGKRAGGVRRGEAVPERVSACPRSIHQPPAMAAGPAPGLLQDPRMAAQDLPELAVPVQATWQQWRLCAAQCGPGQRQEYPRPIGLAPQRWRARESRFAGPGPARRLQAAERGEVTRARAPRSQTVWNVPAHWLWHSLAATREWLPRMSGHGP